MATANTTAAIWSRLLEAQRGDWSPETARGILALRLSDTDRERMHELAAKAQEQTLTPDEEIEIESYRHISRLLELLKAKARVALKHAGVDT